MSGTNTAQRPAFIEGNLHFPNALTLLTASGTVTLDKSYGWIVGVDCNGAARNLLLPASPSEGMFYRIVNTTASTYAITVKNSAGTSVSNGSVAASTAKEFIYTAGAWVAVGGYALA